MKIKRLIFLSVNQIFFKNFSKLFKNEKIENYFVLREGIEKTIVEDEFGICKTIPYIQKEYIQKNLNEHLNNKFDETCILCRDIKVDLSCFSKFIFIVTKKSKYITLLDISGKKREVNRFEIILLKIRILLNKIKIDCKKKLYQFNIASYIQDFLYQTFSIIVFFITSSLIIIFFPFLRLYKFLKVKILKRWSICLAKRVHSDQSYIISEGLKKLGVKTLTINVIPHPFNYKKCDLEYDLNKINPYLRFLIINYLFLKVTYISEVLLFENNGESFFVSPLFYDWKINNLYQYLELILYKIAGVKIIFEMRDCTNYDVNKNLNSNRRNICKYCSENRMKKLCGNKYYVNANRIATKFAHKILCSTLDLKSHLVKNNEWLPNGFIPVPEVEYSQKEKKIINIIHSATCEFMKGTSVVRAVVEKLSIKYNIMLEVLRGIPHQEVIKRIFNADIVLGQFNAGWYGNFDIECMMFGKPILGYINPDFLNKDIENPPIISIDENNFEENLLKKVEELILNEDLRKEIGKKSKEYAMKTHDYINVSKKLKMIIDKMLNIN